MKFFALLIPALLFAAPSFAATNALPAAPLLYQLQNLDVTQAAASAFSVIVTDYSHDGSGSGELIAQEVATLQAGGSKIVLAYLSIGEAEDYRFYWNSAWTTNPPAWLGPVNRDFRGNFEVRYWDPAWQTIIFSYLDRILARGFDGVYLDIVDGFEFWGADGRLPVSQQNSNAVADMIMFVTNLAAYARSQHANFLVVPQNGSQLVTNAAYLTAISGIGNEDIWFNGDKRQRPDEISFILAFLDLVRDAGKPVFAIDYPRREKNIDAFYSFAEARGYVPSANVRELDRLFVQPRHDPASTLTVTLQTPADGASFSSSNAPTFGWSGNGSGYRLNFSGNDAYRKVIAVPKSGWLTATNYTPTAREWKKITARVESNLTWWVTAQDAAGQLRSSGARQLSSP